MPEGLSSVSDIDVQRFRSFNLKVFNAAVEGRMEAVKAGVLRGGSHQAELDGTLVRNASQGQVSLMHVAFRQGAKANAEKSIGLLLAAQNDQRDAFDLLLENGAVISDAFNAENLGVLAAQGRTSSVILSKVRSALGHVSNTGVSHIECA